MTNPLIRRIAAVEACIARFDGKTYDCASNRDCIKLAGHALHKLGRRVGLTKGLRYSSEAGGVKAMRKLGFASLIEAMDAALPGSRIPPASALPGDIVALATDDDSPFGCALTVAVGNGRVLGFREGICCVVQPFEYLTAWRSVGPVLVMGPTVNDTSAECDLYDSDDYRSEIY